MGSVPSFADETNAMPKPSHIPLALLVLSAITWILTAVAAAESKNQDKNNNDSGLPTYRSAVSEVRVTFFATDENNHPLESLTKSDFAVVDSERIVRNFRSFTHSDETALDLVILVDTSESVAPRFRIAINDVLQLVAREQSIANDNLSVLSFGGSAGSTHGGRARQTTAELLPAVLCSSGCRTSDSVAKFQAVQSGGLTPLYDALIFTADFLSQHRRPGVRPVVILFSDGNDTISLHSANDALQAARDTGALIYSIDVTGSEKKRASTQTAGGAFLQQLSNATGGRYFSPRSSSDESAASLLNTVLEDLRASYVVTYDLPSHQAGFHAFRLLPTHNLNLTFHSRNGYIYEPSGD